MNVLQSLNQKRYSCSELSRWLKRAIICSIIFIIVTWTLPWRWTSRHAKHWYNDDAKRQIALANGVSAWIEGPHLQHSNFNTGSDTFDGEWLFGSYVMAGIGYGQLISLHPEQAPTALPLMEQCITRILDDDVRIFDREAWKNDPIDTLDEPDQHHAAYLGYLNVLLGLYRLHAPENRYAELHDRITTALIHRIEQSPTGILQTYPEEGYPVDNCAVVGSIGLHARATGQNHDPLIAKWVATCRNDYLCDETGLLYQAVRHNTGFPVDRPRGSGTSLGGFFINFADSKLSADMFTAMQTRLFGTVMGFGGMREYRSGTLFPIGDIDSGPILFGYGLSSTGFALSGAKTHKDYKTFKRLFATAWGAGAPLKKAGSLNFVTGESLGDAILFAMLTSHPADELRPLKGGH